MAANATMPIGAAHRRPLAWALAVVFHLGMLAIAISCVYTQQPPTAGRLFYITVALLALSLPLVLCVRVRSAAARSAMAPLTALAAAITYSFAYEPQLEAVVPSAIARLPMVILELAPGIGLAGLLLASIATAVYLAAGCDRHLVRVRMSRAVLAAAGLVIGLGLVMYVALAPIYDLQGGMQTRLLIGRTVEYALLGLVVMRMYGLRGIGSVPAWYFAAALFLAAGRHLLGIGITH